jgi:Zn ribbon nucleic-acid-binding protein
MSQQQVHSSAVGPASTPHKRYAGECPRCASVLLCPEWSEQVAADRVVNLWHCAVCGHDFETVDERAGAAPSPAELMRAFFPSLLVA